MTKWHGINWTLTVSYPGTEIDLKPGVANTFRFDRQPPNGSKIVLYGMKSQPPNPPTLKDAWLNCVLVPQRGLPIQNFLQQNEPAVDPTDVTRVQFLVDRYTTLYLEPFGDTFERLVGTVKFNNGTHHAVAFYQVPNVCADPAKILLMSHVRFVGPSPGGVVAGNN